MKEKVLIISSELGKVKQPNCHNESDHRRVLPCKECNETFTMKKELRQHIAMSHTKYLTCKICNNSFDANKKLEDHLIKVHNKSKKYDFTECDMSFVLQWRLNKHIRGHKKSVKPTK